MGQAGATLSWWWWCPVKHRAIPLLPILPNPVLLPASVWVPFCCSWRGGSSKSSENYMVTGASVAAIEAISHANFVHHCHFEQQKRVGMVEQVHKRIWFAFLFECSFTYNLVLKLYEL